MFLGPSQGDEQFGGRVYPAEVQIVALGRPNLFLDVLRSTTITPPGWFTPQEGGRRPETILGPQKGYTVYRTLVEAN